MDYLGEVVDVMELEKRYPKDNVGVFCLALSSSLFLDAAR